MSDHELFLQTIESIYASGIDREQLVTALVSTSRLIGAAATFEVIDTSKLRHVDYLAASPYLAASAVRDASRRYVDEFAAMNPLIPYAVSQPVGTFISDHQYRDESRQPFFTEFLSKIEVYH